jgi:hypothetical protein
VDVGEAVSVVLLADVVVAVPVAGNSVTVVVVAVGDDDAELVSVVANMVEKEPPEVVSGSVSVLTMTEAPEAAESSVNVMATPDMIVTVTDTAASACTTPESTSAFSTAAAVVVRVDEPSKVTRAFSATHDRLAVLNLERIVVAERGREKLV